MCKAWTINYTCKHSLRFQLSTCRGTFLTQPKASREPKAMCSMTPILNFSSASRCGACERAEMEESMQRRVDELRLASEWIGNNEVLDSSQDDNTTWLGGAVEEKEEDDADLELETALQEQGSLQFRLERMYPSTPTQLKKFRVPEKGRRTTLLRRSLLRYEVVLEAGLDDSQEDNEASNSGWEDWSSCWTTSDITASSKIWNEETEAWEEENNEQVEDEPASSTVPSDPYYDNLEDHTHSLGQAKAPPAPLPLAWQEERSCRHASPAAVTFTKDGRLTCFHSWTIISSAMA